MTAEETEFPPSLGKVALRVLAANGLTQFTQLTDRSEGGLRSIHGVGPKTIRILREELCSRGLSFRMVERGAQERVLLGDWEHVASN